MNGFWLEKVTAHIAQSVEHFLGKEEVIGSNPIVSTRIKGLQGRKLLHDEEKGQGNLHLQLKVGSI